MGHRKTSRAVAIVTVVWLMAAVAALALATTSEDVAAALQRGCTGGNTGSPSASASSASPSPTESSQIPTIVPSLVPGDIGQGAKPPAAAGPAQQPAPASPAPAPEPARAPGQLDPYEKVPVAPAAQQSVSCKSTVTISYRSTGKPAFTGKVGSGEPMCKKARRVQVKKLKDGKDPTVARGVTNAKGAYTAPEPNANGKYYAVVAKSTTENDDGESVTCQAARSKAIRV